MIFSITNILFFWPLIVYILRLVVRFAFLVIVAFVFVPSLLYFYYDGFTQVESKLEHQVCCLDQELSELLWLQTSGAEDRPCSKRCQSPSQWVEFCWYQLMGFCTLKWPKKSLCERNFPVGLSTEKTIWELQISLFASQDISGVVAKHKTQLDLILTVWGKKSLTPMLEAKEIDITTEMTRKALFGVRKDCAVCERVIISLWLPPDEGKVGRFDGETQLDRLPLLRWDQFGGDGGTRCSHVFCFVHPFLRDVDHR